MPVVLSDCAALAPHIKKIFAAWPHREDAPGGDDLASRAHKIVLQRRSGIYVLAAPWLDDPIRHRDPVHMICDLVVHLIHGFIATNPSILCLHSAAALMGGRLVVFPNVYRGGKSLLSGHLAAAGVQIFSDDVVPVRGRGYRGMALGIAPRLRLPLPETVSAEFSRFVTADRGPAGTRYKYLDLGPDRLAPFGSQAPIGAFVLLDRRDGAEAALTPLDRGEALRRVIARNFARRVPARRILQRLERLVMTSPCYRLSYDDSETAVGLLRARFDDQAGWRERRRKVKTPDVKTIGEEYSRPVVSPAEPGPWRRPGHVIERCVAGELFLINEETDSIYHLNPMAGALWRLTGEPVTEADMIELVAAAFPGEDRARIAKDVAALLKSLMKRGLLARR